MRVSDVEYQVSGIDASFQKDFPWLVFSPTTAEDVAKGIAHFTTNRDEKILVKVGISPVSIENAANNKLAGIPHWNLSTMASQADASWNHELNKVRIETKDQARMRTSYTALYHTMIAPSIFNDYNGDYRVTDKKVYEKASFTNLTTFSLWDTYRAANLLFTILQPDKVNEIVNSMLAIYKQQGTLPVWHLMGNETNTMPGYSAVQVVADAYLKGFRDFDMVYFFCIGVYPVNPCNGLYVFGSPLFDKATLALANGNKLTIDVKNNSANNKYIQRISLDGKPYSTSYISHQQLLKGGLLSIEMGSKPLTALAWNKKDRPYSAIK